MRHQRNQPNLPPPKSAEEYEREVRELEAERDKAQLDLVTQRESWKTSEKRTREAHNQKARDVDRMFDRMTAAEEATALLVEALRLAQRHITSLEHRGLDELDDALAPYLEDGGSSDE